MKIGVSGASGKLGQAVIANLARRTPGHDIIGISRTPAAVTAPAEGRFGDYDQPSSLAEAYAGLDRLLIIPTAAIARGVRGAQNLAAIDAAVRAGVGHVVFMSSAGTREEAEPAIGASYWVGEQRLIKTAPRWTILRMNYYAETLAREAQMALAGGVLTGLAENRVAFVSREDVAAAAAGILTGEGHAGALYQATGPARLSGAERAALIAEAAGRPMEFRAVSEARFRADLAAAGRSEDIVNAVTSIQASFAAGGFDVLSGDVERLSGAPPRPLRDVLAGALG